MNKQTLLATLVPLLVACTAGEPGPNSTGDPSVTHGTVSDTMSASAPTGPATERLATFAGGCFWCMEIPFEELPGVSAVISGYTDGAVEFPTYKAVCSGTTGHTEAIQVHYDETRVSYSDLLEVFWRQIDPTDAGGQFVDRGSQYRASIFFHDAEQEQAALASKQALADSGRFADPIVTEIKAYTVFYEAEEYHQDYHDKSPGNYGRYRSGSGRDRFLDKTWGEEREVHLSPPAARWEKPSDAVLREELTDLQYRVTQEDATERSFKNEYWDNKRPGIYVDIVSGEPLFSSLDKFKSGTGWPSFTRPLVPGNIAGDVDYDLGYARNEVRSKHGDSHLGHVFEDGPKPTGLRYCMNSAALRFIPADKLELLGYGEFQVLFAGGE